jgi:outer membrane protein TolC
MNTQARPTPHFIDTDALCDEAESAGMAWADAKAAYEALEQTRKSVLAQGMKGYFEEGMAGNKAETMALADEGYYDFVQKMVKAGHAADRARVRYDILKTRIELLRTNASTERAAMSMR